MSIASDPVERHIQTLVGDPVQWRTLIADESFGNWRMRRPSATPRGSRAAPKLLAMWIGH